MRATRAILLPGNQAEENTGGKSAHASPRPTVGDACPEDCHYCSGPETD